MEITYRQFENAFTADVIKLQDKWAKENITYGYCADSYDEIVNYDTEYFYVAIDSGQVVGYVTAEVCVNNDNGYMNVFPKGEKYLRVNDLYVSADYRSKHIGEKLLTIVEEKAMGNGIQHFYISSATKDAEAVRRFYQRNGYQIWTTVFFK